MADVLHHQMDSSRDMRTDAVPSHVYGAAVIGFILLAALFAYAAVTGGDAPAPSTFTDNPFVPFVPIL